jgi:diguanylate cyclase (GGDEF)-like protein
MKNDFLVLNEISQGIIILDSAFRIRFWNKYLSNLTGIKLEEAFNKKIDTVLYSFKDKFLKKLLLDTITNNQKLFVSAALHNNFVGPQEDVLKQNMRLITLEKEGEKYLLIELEDVTCSYLRIKQLKEYISKLQDLQKSLDKSELRYRMLFEKIDKPFICVETVANIKGEFDEFVICDANPQFLALIDKSKLEVIGKGLIEIFESIFCDSSCIEKLKQMGKRAVKHLPTVIDEFFISKVNKYFSVSGYFGTDVCDVEGFRYAIMFTDITAQKENDRLMRYMAYHDHLTGLFNRKFFMKEFNKYIKQAEQSNTKMAFIFVDIDKFKLINDIYGHHFGDKYLVEISKMMMKNLRECDILARYGGDEFLILMPFIRNLEDCISLVEQFSSNLEMLPSIEGLDEVPTLSIGIALYPDNGKTYEELLKQADSAMYRAKQQKGKTVYSF